MTDIVRSTICAILTGFTMLAQPARASEPDDAQSGYWVLKAGPAATVFDSSATVRIAGATVPGGDLSLSNGATVSAELEYRLDRHLSVAFNFGLPPKTRIDGAGSLAAAGEAGRIRYGLGAAVMRYHLNAGHPLSPYAGVGVGRLFILDADDGAVSGLHAEGAWGPVMQIGADLRIARRVVVYANVSHAPLKTDAGGSMFTLPVEARVTLDPTVVQGGLGFRF